jgi:large subunit ribosomal protein L17
MRHRAKGRQLSRTSSHKRAMLNNMASSLFEHGRVITTEAKAKELRPFAEKLITLARRGDLHARRLVERRIKDRDTLGKLFTEIGPRFAARPGGYTRILKLGHRRGDGAETALIELVGSEFDPKKAAAEKAAAAEAGEAPKSQKSVGERLRTAASRIRGDKKDKSGAPNKPANPGRRAPKKSTTPRKAGGS